MAADRVLTWGIENVNRATGGAPFWMTQGLNLMTILMPVGLAVISAAMLSLLPALKVTRARVQPHLANRGTGGATLRFGRVWTGAMIVQLALTALLSDPGVLHCAGRRLRLFFALMRPFPSALGISVLVFTVSAALFVAEPKAQTPTGVRASYTQILFDNVEQPAASPSVSAGVQLVGASVTRDATHIISGNASVLLPSISTLRTDPAVLPLSNGGYYILEFKYRFLNRASGDKTALVKLIRTDNSDPQFEVWSTALLNNAADQGTFSTGALVPTSGTYAIGVFVYFPGSIVVDDISVYRVVSETMTTQPAVWTNLASAPFPRLGNYINGTTDYVASGAREGVPFPYSADQVEERVAFSDVVVGVGGGIQGRDSGYVRRLRQKNPGIVVLPYRISYEQPVDLFTFPNATIDHDVEFAKLVAGAANGWIVRKTNGEVVPDFTFPNIRKVNISVFCPLVGGYTYNRYLIDWLNNTVIGSGLWDGVFLDNLFSRINSHIPDNSDVTKLDFDLNRNGLRDETPAYVSEVTRAAGNQILQGVRDARGDLALIVGNAGPLAEPAMARHVNGYTFECVNDSWNDSSLPAGFSEIGWRRMLDAYFTMQANTRSPHLNILEGCGRHSGVSPTATDLRDHRLVLGTALLSDGYAEYDLYNAESAPYWFDEYSVNSQGVAVENRQFKGYLGQPFGSAIELATPATIVWSEQFESPALPATLVVSNAANGYISRAAADIVEGTGSLVLHNPDRTSRATSFVRTDGARVPLVAGRTYLLEFDWRVLETFDNAFQGLKVEVPGAAVGSYWAPGYVTGDAGKARIPLSLPAGGPYQIHFFAVDAGKVAIDNVRLTDGGVGPWRRDFENGFVVVNPITRPATFTAADLSGAFKRTGVKRILGTQDPVTNSGQAVSALTLGGGEAIILLADPMPLVDSDGDAIPDIVETKYGLNPSSAAGDDGAGGDPDGDGVTNLNELAAGTDPTLANTQSFPEGATGFFTELIAVANPGTDEAQFTVTFLREGGAAPITQTYTLAAQARMTIDVGQISALAGTAVSANVNVTKGGVVAARRMMWDARDGSLYGGHLGKALSQNRTTWYLAEGEASFFDTYILLSNAGSSPATVTLRFLLTAGAPVERQYTVGANARVTVHANSVPGLAGKAFSTVVTSNVPIGVERAMYFGSTAARLWNGGHEASAVESPATSWFVAEGRTGSFFDMYLLLANPGAAQSAVTIRYLKPGGAVVTQNLTLAPTSRVTVHVDGLSGLEDTDVSASVTADQPIIVERAMYWPDPFTSWYEAHSSAGVTATGTRWALADGEIGGPLGFETYILLANPGSSEATVTLTFLRTSGSPVTLTRTVPGNARLTVSAGEAGLTSGERFGVLVVSSVAIAVEEAIYWNGGAQFWGAGVNETGVRMR